MTQINDNHETRSGNSLINATYVWRGDRCLGFYFWDASQGLWRICNNDTDDVTRTEEEAKKVLLGENNG